MTVVDQLTSLAAGHGEAKSEHDVVKTLLKDSQEVFTGDAGHLLGSLIVQTELLFEDAVDELDLLLLIELHAVLALLFANLSLGVADGVDLALAGVTQRGRGDAQRLCALNYGLCILCHYLYPPSIRRGDVSEDGSHYEEWG